MPQRVELVLLPEEAAREQEYRFRLSRQLGLAESEIHAFRLARRSIDARSKQVKFRLFFDVALHQEVLPEQGMERDFRQVGQATPVLVVGAGPAGLFAALRLIELGYKPVLIERGKDVRSRRRDLAAISRQGEVNPDSNYCFGEGGAGTYSDGKLYTRSDKRGNVQKMLDTFVYFGAPPDIRIDAHPHIGTNKLPGIVTAMRERIEACGGEVHFQTRLESLHILGGEIRGARVKSTGGGAEYILEGKALLLATGHSARDVFRLLQAQGVQLEAKDFALGVRIEHPQQIIDQQQYHCRQRPGYLPAASYSLSGQYEGRGVYSFCMCPGGIIAPAATSPGEIVVNGWSPSKRNNPYANSGMVVSVGAKDFKKFSPHGALAAMEYQASVEQACFAAGGGKLVAPAQRLVDFCEQKFSPSLPGNSYLPGVKSVDLKEVLPPAVALALRKGLMDFGKKMKGYYSNEALLVATESRTSSPVRIPRDHESCMHPGLKGLFPCAEGAGYAGGIVSAAMDGERCAEAAVRYLAGQKP
ncbi:MAG: FAD-binding protein [Bacteroidia bacterium]|nr:FAD-binding protein [Bacteroidia bacterium]